MVFAKPEMHETQRIMFCGFAVYTKVSQCYVSYFLLGSINTHMMFSSKTQALVWALFIEHKLLFHTEDAICSYSVNRCFGVVQHYFNQMTIAKGVPFKQEGWIWIPFFM